MDRAYVQKHNTVLRGVFKQELKGVLNLNFRSFSFELKKKLDFLK